MVHDISRMESHLLRAWVAESRLTHAQVADLIGVSRVAVTRYLSRLRGPVMPGWVAANIERATGIRCVDLFPGVDVPHGTSRHKTQGHHGPRRANAKHK